VSQLIQDVFEYAMLLRRWLDNLDERVKKLEEAERER
jgi:hypothetical protein